MASIDRRAIDGGKLGIDLMEAAGCGVTQVLENLLGGFQNRRIVILCGKGNNGGDGFVVARHAAQATIQVFLAAPPTDVQGDARINLDRLPPGIVSPADDIEAVKKALANADAVVDALLGTGIRGPARGIYPDLINALASAKCPIIAVDVPSGLNADTGQIEGPCAAATCTVTFALPRIGHFFYPGRTYCGRLHLFDIGIPDSAIQGENHNTYLIDNRHCVSLLPHRAPDAHKGDCGRVCILAGSVGLTGAAALTAKAALRGGAGLVTLGVPQSLNDILEAKVTEVMTLPLPEVKKARCLSLRARSEIQRLFQNAQCVALGPGLGTHRETVELIRRLLHDLSCPAVIDADALNALAGDIEILQSCPVPLVLTPHLGEFARLTKSNIVDIRKNPIAAAQKFASKMGVTVILKGAPTVVATPKGEAHINPTGNAGMATGGSGDVLTGLLAALIGQNLNVSDAARLAVYLHGLAGDIASKTTGQLGLIASDIIENLAGAMHHITSGADLHRDLYLHPNPTL
jgi:hydroxyethylthiazole kinase-like uncharacterized protein yjeF